MTPYQFENRSGSPRFLDDLPVILENKLHYIATNLISKPEIIYASIHGHILSYYITDLFKDAVNYFDIKWKNSGRRYAK